MCFCMLSCINNPNAEGSASNFRFTNNNTIAFDWYGDFNSSYIYNVAVYDSAGGLRGHDSFITTETIFLSGSIKLTCSVQPGWYVEISMKGGSTETVYRENSSNEGYAANFHFVENDKIKFNWYGNFEASHITNIKVYDSAGVLQGHESYVTLAAGQNTGTIKLNCNAQPGWYVKLTVKNSGRQTVCYN